jgi:hypothetical protein
MKKQYMSESAVRRIAKQHWCFITKSRRAQSMDNHGEYRLVDADTNNILLGERYDATLEDIAEWFNED